MAQAGVMAAMAAMQIVQGVSENDNLRVQAGALDENARRTETQGAYDAVSSLRQSRLQEGADITAGAASGSGLGSISDLLEQNAIERQLDAMNIRYSAGQRADGLRMEANQKRADGRAAIFGGVLRAGASAIQTASQNASNASLAGAATRSFNQRMGTAPQAMGSIPVPAGRTMFDPAVGWRYNGG